MTLDLRRALLATSPLPEGWSSPEIVEDTIVADGVSLRRAGLSSIAPGGEELTGSAVEVTTDPVSRAYFELLERVTTFEALRARRASYDLLTEDGTSAGQRLMAELFPESDAPERWRYARSNGVSLHTTWSNAARRALWELAERDRVLRAWYGEIAPARLALAIDASPLGGAHSYDWRAYSFPETASATFSHGVQVAGVFGFPKVSGAPMVCGYAARADLSGAVDAAVSESLQLLAFLWGEPALERLPELTPTPMHHLEHLQWPDHHDALRRWLDGAHLYYRARADRKGEMPSATSAPDVAFIDLTPTWLGAGLRVAKAICAEASPLAFGDVPFAAHLPRELRVHPIA